MKKEVNPAVLLGVIAALVIGLLVVVFFTLVKPKLEADRALAEFNTPEAQAKRDPDQRKVPAGLQLKINEIRAKEGHTSGPRYLGRRDRE